MSNCSQCKTTTKLIHVLVVEYFVWILNTHFWCYLLWNRMHILHLTGRKYRNTNVEHSPWNCANRLTIRIWQRIEVCSNFTACDYTYMCDCVCTQPFRFIWVEEENSKRRQRESCCIGLHLFCSAPWPLSVHASTFCSCSFRIETFNRTFVCNRWSRCHHLDLTNWSLKFKPNFLNGFSNSKQYQKWWNVIGDMKWNRPN